jgi:hypothetical protein
MILLVNVGQYFEKQFLHIRLQINLPTTNFLLCLLTVMSAMERKADIFEECRKKMIPTFQVNSHKKQRTKTGHSN